jgi:hypothetical protein
MEEDELRKKMVIIKLVNLIVLWYCDKKFSIRGSYEAGTLLGLGVSRSQTHISV